MAADLGADAVGFVFAPSVRQVTVAQVAEITPHLPDEVERVGVFPAWNAAEIVAAVREAGLTAVQLHGEFDSELVRALRESLGSEIRIIQTVSWAVSEDGLSEAKVRGQMEQIRRDAFAQHVLVDSKVGKRTGGTGVAFHWADAQPVFAEPDGMSLILAGGLTPENVHGAITLLRPWGVDVASGVETRAGRKDAAKVARFIEEAKKSASY